MPANKAAAFNSCGKAILSAYTGTSISDTEKRELMEGWKLLMGLIRDVAGDEASEYLPQVTNALQYLHPKTEYCVAMIIRDLADVCVTIERLTKDKSRSAELKVMEAQTLCLQLRYEFKDLAEKD